MLPSRAAASTFATHRESSPPPQPSTAVADSTTAVTVEPTTAATTAAVTEAPSVKVEETAVEKIAETAALVADSANAKGAMAAVSAVYDGNVLPPSGDRNNPTATAAPSNDAAELQTSSASSTAIHGGKTAATSNATTAVSNNIPAPGSSNGSESNNANVNACDKQQINKRKERLEQNRISARESRKRKKSMIEELQRTVIALTSENKDLNSRNQSLRSNLAGIGQKVRFFTIFVSFSLGRKTEFMGVVSYCWVCSIA